MKANVANTRQSDKIRTHRKENSFDRQWSAIDPKTGSEIVCVRTYWPGQTCHACVWVKAGDFARGAGKAGGGGYCKQSASVAEAIADAGIKSDHDIHGRGIDAIRDAVLAIAQAATGKRKFHIVEAHA